jgi:hypothetical protein
MILEEFLSAEQSQKMRILGFNENCLGYWIQDSSKKETLRFFLVSDLYDAPEVLKARIVINGDILEWSLGDTPAYAAPLINQAKKWMEDRHGVYCTAGWILKENKFQFQIKWISEEGEHGEEGLFETFTEADNASLDFLLDYCLEKSRIKQNP